MNNKDIGLDFLEDEWENDGLDFLEDDYEWLDEEDENGIDQAVQVTMNVFMSTL